jgi:hypothetical protein
LKISRSPLPSTITADTELPAPATRHMPSAATPSRAKCAPKTSAAASSPTGPTKRGDAPSRETATSALAVMPPTPQR